MTDADVKRFLSSFERQTMALEFMSDNIEKIVRVINGGKVITNKESSKESIPEESPKESIPEESPKESIPEESPKESIPEEVSKESIPEESPKEESFSEDELREKYVVPFAQKFGMATASKLLKDTCKVDKLGKVKPEQYEALIKAIADYK